MKSATWLVHFSETLLDLKKSIKSLEQPVNDFIMDFFDDPLYSLQPDSGNMAGRVLLQPQTTLSVSVYVSRQCFGLFNKLSLDLQGLPEVFHCIGFASPFVSLNGCFGNVWERTVLSVRKAADSLQRQMGIKARHRMSANYPGEAHSSSVTTYRGNESENNFFMFTNGTNPVLSQTESAYTYVNHRSFLPWSLLFTFVTSPVSSFVPTFGHRLNWSENLISKLDTGKRPALHPFLTILAEKISLWSLAHPWTTPGKYLQKVLNLFYYTSQRLNLFKNMRFSLH